VALDAVTATGNLIVSPLANLWFSFIKVLPGIVAAIIVWTNIMKKENLQKQ